MANMDDIINKTESRKSFSVSLDECNQENSKFNNRNCNHFKKTFLSENEMMFFLGKEDSELHLDPIFKETLSSVGILFAESIKEASNLDINNKLKKYIIENFFQSARSLAISLEARDPYTGGHSDRVFQVSKEIGRRCNLSPIEQMHLEGGSLLHDIGKIGIRDSVLLKPGPLTDSEYREMQLHPIIGAQIIEKIDVLKGCYDAVLYHHERIDGYGYPYGLKGSEIPITARITSITDAYDAMTTNRVYRKALSHEQAIDEIIRNSGTQFDSEVAKVFVAWWEENFKFSSTGKEIYSETII